MKHSVLSLPLLLRRSLWHRRSRTLAELAALTVSAAVATALLTLYGSIELKLHHQFRAFGANIVVTAQNATGKAGAPAALPPNALLRARQATGEGSRVIPFAYAIAQMPDGSPIVVAGTNLKSAKNMNSWWQVDRSTDAHAEAPKGGGNALSAPIQALTGARAAKALGSSHFQLSYNGRPVEVETAETVRTGDAEDSRVYLPLAAFTAWTGVSPGTLEIQATGNTQQIEGVVTRLRQALPEASVRPVHQLVEAEANVVSRTRSLMLGSLVLILLTVAVCVLATLSASVLERRRDFAIMKSLGATQGEVERFFLLEIFVLAIAGIVLGYALGCGIADLIGEWNFQTAILPLWRVLPQIALLNLVVAFVAAAIPMQILRRLEPAALLQGE